MFSRFQTLVTGLKVQNKRYFTSDHVKKIIRSLPSKWRPVVTELKTDKDLNNTSLEELVSSLRSHEIEIEQDEPQKIGKSINLRCSRKSKKTKALQAKGEEDLSENFDEDKN